MKKEEETQDYLPPQEQLIISAKIHNLCEVTAETFDPEIHVAEAQEIIRALDPRIKPESERSFGYYSNSSSLSQVRAGSTNAGNVNASFEEQKSKKVEFGVHEYKIGNYIATKHVHKKFNFIHLEEFWDRGSVNQVFDKTPQSTIILYEQKSLDLVRISKMVPTVKQLGLKLRNRKLTARETTLSENRLWQRKK